MIPWVLYIYIQSYSIYIYTASVNHKKLRSRHAVLANSLLLFYILLPDTSARSILPSTLPHSSQVLYKMFPIAFHHSRNIKRFEKDKNTTINKTSWNNIFSRVYFRVTFVYLCLRSYTSIEKEREREAFANARSVPFACPIKIKDSRQSTEFSDAERAGLSRLRISQSSIEQPGPLSRSQCAYTARCNARVLARSGFSLVRSRGEEKVNFAWPLNRYRYYVGEAESTAQTVRPIYRF